MALRELSKAAGLFAADARPGMSRALVSRPTTRHASSPPSTTQTPTPPPDADLESTTFGEAPPSTQYDPLFAHRQHKGNLPRSRYQFRPPKYFRGPLHPHQPPPAWEPSSREFLPGPFSVPRLQQTYKSTFEPDLMVLAYQHFPPGYTAPTTGPRLRSWDDSSPYHRNRPLRPPRGGDPLRPLRRPITFRNVPELEGITVHSFVQESRDGSKALHVAGMALQAITGVRATSHQAKKSVVQWGARAGKYMSLTCTLDKEAAYHFLSKTVDVVLPRVKEWRGVPGSSGDSSGNIAFGLEPEALAMYPEIEVNYDSYPSKLIPGCHVIVKTSAKSDRDARLLLTSFGLPFYGKHVN